MPFKDVNLQKLDSSRKIHKQLYNKIAEVNKLTSSTIEDDKNRLPTVELISGKKVQSIQSNPVEMIQKRLDAIEAAKPVTDKLQKLSDQQGELLDYQDLLTDQQDMLLNQMRIEPPRPQQAIADVQLPESDPKTQSVNIEKLPGVTVTEHDITELQKISPEFDNMNQVFLNYHHSPLTFLRFKDSVLKKLNKLKGEKGALSKNFRQGLVNKDEYDTQRAELDSIYMPLKRYNESLNIIKAALIKRRGRGTIPIGDYCIDKKRLNRDNILSVRYNKNKNMVGKFGAKKVSDNVKQVIHHDRICGDIKLSDTEKQFLDKLYLNAGSKLSPSKAQLIRGGEVFTSLDEMSDKLKVIMGQIHAGNTSTAIRNEAMDILHYLYKNKKIKKQSYTDIVKFLTKN